MTTALKPAPKAPAAPSLEATKAKRRCVRLEMTITSDRGEETVYNVKPLPDGFTLTKLDSNEVYEIKQGRCSCPAYKYGLRFIDGKRCKHISALQALGIPVNQSMPARSAGKHLEEQGITQEPDDMR